MSYEFTELGVKDTDMLKLDLTLCMLDFSLIGVLLLYVIYTVLHVFAVCGGLGADTGYEIISAAIY